MTYTLEWLIKGILSFFAILGFGVLCALGWFLYCCLRWHCQPYQIARDKRWAKRLNRENIRLAKARARRHVAGEFTPSPWEKDSDITKPANPKRKT